MKEYQKIETLWVFNQDTKSYLNVIKNPIVEMLKDIEWIFTEKIDGMNFRIHWDGHKLSYAGRTDNTQFSKSQLEFIEANLITEAMTNAIEQMFMEKTCTIFGELYGAGIQKGGLYSPTVQFAVFDVMVNDTYLSYQDVFDIAHQLGLKRVPIVGIGNLQFGIDFVNGVSESTFSEAPLEGLVAKPLYPLYDKNGNRIVVKIKARDMPKGE